MSTAPRTSALQRLADRAARVSPLVYEAAFVLAVTAAALLLRTWDLANYPPGFHGDEGLMGLDAQRVLKEGWIGPWLPATALGVPAGPAYWTAAVVRALGDTPENVRFALALLGTATVPIAYFAFRAMFGPRAAALAAIFLAFSAWHIHFSRIAYITGSLPLIVVATTLALFLAIKHGRWWLFLVAGIFAGLSAYTYQAYPVFVAALGVFAAWLGIAHYFPRRLHHYVRDMAAAFGGFYFAALSMINYVRDHENFLDTTQRRNSLRETPQWKEADGVGDKYRVIRDRAQDAFGALTDTPRLDGIDATGVGHMFGEITLLLLAVGVLIALWNVRRLPYAYLLIMLAVLPAAAVITVTGEFRRMIAFSPFLAVFMALPLERAWRAGDARTGWGRAATYAAIAAIVAWVGWRNVDYYFSELTTSQEADYVFATELASASRFIDERQPDKVVLFSARWDYGYPTRLYLAPGIPGEDRSREHRRRPDANTPPDPGAPYGPPDPLAVDPAQDTLFVFIGANYMALAPLVQARYQGTTVYIGERHGRTLFSAALVPRQR